VAGTFDGSSLRLYKDGLLIAGPVAATPATASNPTAVLGSAFGAFYFNGDVDELRISSTNRSTDWIAAEYSNQNNPATFISMGGESCPSGTPTPTPTATPTPPFGADNFNRANGGLGSNWAKPVPASEQTLVIVNNQVTPDTDGAHCYAYWIGNTFSQDQYSQARISNVGSWNGVITRAQSTVDRFYLAFVFAPNDYRIFLRKDGLYYTLSQGSTETWVAGDIIRLETVGLNPVQLTLFRNGNPVLTYTDSTENLTGGSPGIGIWTATEPHLAVDDWEGGNVAMQGGLARQTQPPSVQGNLAASASGVSQVELSWTTSTDSVGEKKYEVQRRDPGSPRFVRVGTTRGTSYTDTGLAAGSDYSYRVLVRDAKGRAKRYSSVASVITASPTIVPRTPR
ncbi:MAG: LamG-like jellyroll fold domain-containing protein, partial [Candidatus Udaeobacter sp.]